MEIDKKIKLERLKEKQKERNLINETKKLKLQIINEIPLFHEKFSFINDEDTKEVDVALSFLPPMLGTVPNFELFYDVKRFEPITEALILEGNAWLKFACGGANYNEFVIYGSISNFIKDIHFWLTYSSPIYLLCENKQDIIFIEWYTNAIKASIPKKTIQN